MIKRMIGISIFMSLSIQPFSNYSFFYLRSQEINGARTLVGWQQLRTDLFAGYYEGNVSLAVEYTRSFDHTALNSYLFGGQELVFSGSRVPGRASTDLLADYFGLPTDFKSTVCFKPRIENIIADFDWYAGLHYVREGLFIRLNSALVNSRWDLRAQELVGEEGVLNYPAGYMSPLRLDRDILPTSALQALSGTVTFGDLDAPLAFGKITGKQDETKLADILLAIGQAWTTERSQIALSVHTVVPTGTRSHACTLFEPQIGNGHHWALGVGAIGYCQLRVDECRQSNVSLYVDLRIEHLFKSWQKRSFDFNNGPGSRYMLLTDMGDPIAGLVTLGDGATFIQEQYHGRLFPAINKTTFDSQIKIDVQADVTVKLAVSCGCWEADIGYNWWGRSREKLVCREQLLPGHYALKGDAQLYGFYDSEVAAVGFVPVPLNATQSEATIYAGQGAGNASVNFANDNADNARLASLNITTPLEQSTVEGLEGTGVTILDQVNGSGPAILLTDWDINNCSGLAPRAFSNKLFGHIGYIGQTHGGAVPYLGVGAEAEFATCSNGVKGTVSQWGVWIKGGITY